MVVRDGIYVINRVRESDILLIKFPSISNKDYAFQMSNIDVKMCLEGDETTETVKVEKVGC